MTHIRRVDRLKNPQFGYSSTLSIPFSSFFDEDTETQDFPRLDTKVRFPSCVLSSLHSIRQYWWSYVRFVSTGGPMSLINLTKVSCDG